jgi:hypothetical protein
MTINHIVWKCKDPSTPERITQGIVVRSRHRERITEVRSIANFFCGRWRATTSPDTSIIGWRETWQEAIKAARTEAAETFKRSVDRLDDLSMGLENDHRMCLPP